MPESPPRISLCFDKIQICVPRSKADIARARKLLDMLESEIISEEKPGISPQTHPQIEAKPASAGDQGGLGNLTSKTPEIVPDANLTSFFIPKFTWDKTKEKSYRTIFFFEHEDGRVMISYMLSRLFTTKAVVLALPYPIPRNYPPLQSLDNNKRTAFRFYREYLAKEAASHELVRWKDKKNQDKGIFEDILLHEAENKDEDEIMSEAAREAEEKRMGKLRKAAEANKTRWKDRVENEVTAKTKELRDRFALGLIVGQKEG